MDENSCCCPAGPEGSLHTCHMRERHQDHHSSMVLGHGLCGPINAVATGARVDACCACGGPCSKVYVSMEINSEEVL